MFKGEYKKINSSGSDNIYQFNDVVLFEGSLYKAVKETSLSPYQDTLAWEYYGINNIFFSNTPPINPKQGQQWVNNNIIYTYYHNGNTGGWNNY